MSRWFSTKSNNNWRITVENISPSTTIRNLIFNQKIDTATFVSAVSIWDTDFTVEAGHNIVTWNQISIQEWTRGFQAIVLNVSTNDITIDTPFDFAYTTSSRISRSNNNMKTVNWTLASPILFNIWPIEEEIIDVTRIIVYISSSSAMDDNKFGSETALTNWIILRSKQNWIYNNILNFKSNWDLALRLFETKYVDKTWWWLHSFVADMKLWWEWNTGAIVRLDGSTSDAFELLIQDDLNSLTNITEIKATLHGRVAP